MMAWESSMSKDLRCSRGILEMCGVNRTLEALGGGPNRRCSKKWATCGRNSSKGPPVKLQASRLNSLRAGAKNMQSRTTRFEGSGGREGALRNLH